MFPPEGGEGGGGLVRVVYNPRTGRYMFQDPENNNVFLRRDEALARLRYDSELGAFVDSFGNQVGVGAMGLPAAGYAYEFKYKTAEYLPLTVAPEDFQPSPGTTLQVRLVIVDAEGNVTVVYKSFGENQKYDPEVEQKMIQESVSEAVPGQTTVNVGYDGMEGIEVRKDYSVMKVSPKAIGP